MGKEGDRSTSDSKRVAQDWYHIRIRTNDGQTQYMFNLSESAVKRGITLPISQGKKFFTNERFIDPSNVGISIIATSSRSDGKLYSGYSLSPGQYQQLRWEDVVRSGNDVTYDLITIPPEEIAQKVAKEEKVISQSKKVFIVHGHDDSSKNELVAFLYKLGLKPIVLHEQANEGKTVVEKFEQYASDVGYAFVLLTPDDVGSQKGEGEELRPRARQNVILELGYFMGKLGRDRVCGLFKDDVEIPSDVLGVLYLKYQKSIEERDLDIVQELDRAGYKISFGRAQ
jgi:predicted nucleotide-binding protein